MDPFTMAVAAPIVSGLIGKVFGMGGDDPEQQPAPQGYVSPYLSHYDQMLNDALMQQQIGKAPTFSLNGTPISAGYMAGMPTNLMGTKYSPYSSQQIGGGYGDPIQAILQKLQGFSPDQLRGQMGKLDTTISGLQNRSPFSNTALQGQVNYIDQALQSMLGKSDYVPTEMMGQLGAIDQAMGAAGNRTLGYTPEEMEAQKETLRQEISRANDQAMRGINSSMAARGLKGGSMTQAQVQAARNAQTATEQGMRDIILGGAEARRSDQSAMDTLKANLLGMRGSTASGISEATLAGQQAKNSLASNLLGLRGTAAGGMNEASLSDLQNRDSNMSSLLGLRGTSAGALTDAQLQALSQSGNLSQALSGYNVDVAKANQGAYENQNMQNEASRQYWGGLDNSNLQTNVGTQNKLAESLANWSGNNQQSFINNLLQAFSTAQGGAAQSYAAGNNAYSNYLNAQNQQNDLMGGITNGILQTLSGWNTAKKAPGATPTYAPTQTGTNNSGYTFQWNNPSYMQYRGR